MINDLAEIAPAEETLPAGRGSVMIRGIPLIAAAALFRRFPILAALFSGKPASGEDLWNLGPEIAAAVMAAGAGHLGEPKVEAAFAQLSLEHQYDIIDCIWRLTFPGGFGPFVARFVDRTLQLSSALSVTDNTGPVSPPSSSG